MKKFWGLISSHLFIFVFISITLGDGWEKILLWFMSKGVLPMFSSKCFIVSGLTFRSLMHFEFIFVYSVKECSNYIFFFFTQSCLVFPAPFGTLKRLSYLYCSLSSSVIDWSYVHGIIFWALYPVPLIYFSVFVIYISVFVPVPYLVTKFFLGWSTLLLLNQIWVCLPACSKTNLLTPGCGKGENSIDCKVPDKAIRGVSAQNIQISPVGFRETFLQEKLVERAARCVILL